VSRGAGAIAAIDEHASARRRADAKKALARNVWRDRVRVAMTRGALSGDPVHEQDGGSGGGGYHRPPTNRPARPQWLVDLTRATLKPSVSRVPSATPPVKRTGPTLRLPTNLGPRKPPPPPFPGAPAPSGPTPTFSTSSGGGVITGGGGGGGGPINDGGAIPDVDAPVDEYTDDGTGPDAVTAPAAPSGPSGKKVLAIAAGVGALLWLLGRKG
jgi:hypothetical protein